MREQAVRSAKKLTNLTAYKGNNMSKPILFYANLCPDTQPFMTELNALGIEYESVEIMSSMANLKRFLALRDSHLAFQSAKEKGNVGIPVLLLTDGQAILALNDLKQVKKES